MSAGKLNGLRGAAGGESPPAGALVCAITADQVSIVAQINRKPIHRFTRVFDVFMYFVWFWTNAPSRAVHNYFTTPALPEAGGLALTRYLAGFKGTT